jgi:hypothetical protein
MFLIYDNFTIQKGLYRQKNFVFVDIPKQNIVHSFFVFSTNKHYAIYSVDGQLH